EAASRPGGTPLAQWIDRYPNYADELIEIATYNYVFDHGLDSVPQSDEEEVRLRNVAERVSNRLMSEGPLAVKPRTLNSLVQAAEETGLSLTALSDRLQVGIPIVAKLER